MVAALRCVRPQFQWCQQLLAYATEIKSSQLHASIVRLSQKIISFTLHSYDAKYVMNRMVLEKINPGGFRLGDP